MLALQLRVLAGPAELRHLWQACSGAATSSTHTAGFLHWLELSL
jgi:hypothetical protein